MRSEKVRGGYWQVCITAQGTDLEFNRGLLFLIFLCDGRFGYAGFAEARLFYNDLSGIIINWAIETDIRIQGYQINSRQINDGKLAICNALFCRIIKKIL
ncbi:MAG: hypothetical protein D3909_19035 [Candidatus Electrothrix sp. ATG1]|nr:hypothetical protein [Candidatus Electrothrix sp. ATG1]